MARAHTYLIFMIMLVIVLQLAGMGLGGSRLLQLLGFAPTGDISSQNASVQNALQEGINIEQTQLWTAIIAILGFSVVAGLVVGFFTKTTGENYVVLPLISATLIGFIDVILGILLDLSLFPVWLSAV